jgi:pimeloyl-ACP methyl ester carboxylesterase
VMRGERDPISRRWWAERLQEAIPAARFVEIPGKGHVVMFTATDAVVDPIVELASLPQPGLAEPGLDPR